MTTAAAPPEVPPTTTAPRPGLLKAAYAILRKDLALEIRTRESVPAMALFSLTVFVLFHFGLGRDSLEGDLASGVLWVTLLLASVLAVNRLFAAEREQGGLDELRLAPIDLTAVYLAKATALLLYVVVLELVALPAFAILLLGPDLLEGLPQLLPVLALADLGLAAVGALVAGIAAEARARDLIVPLLLLPLFVPLVIAGASAAEPLLTSDPEAQDLAKWLGFLGLYDTVFVLLSVAVFDFLLED
jgi:heme exporter protein B